jgi:hypothetical protein
MCARPWMLSQRSTTLPMAMLPRLMIPHCRGSGPSRRRACCATPGRLTADVVAAGQRTRQPRDCRPRASLAHTGACGDGPSGVAHRAGQLVGCGLVGSCGSPRRRARPSRESTRRTPRLPAWPAVGAAARRPPWQARQSSLLRRAAAFCGDAAAMVAVAASASTTRQRSGGYQTLEMGNRPSRSGMISRAAGWRVTGASSAGSHASWVHRPIGGAPRGRPMRHARPSNGAGTRTELAPAGPACARCSCPPTGGPGGASAASGPFYSCRNRSPPEESPCGIRVGKEQVKRTVTVGRFMG